LVIKLRIEEKVQCRDCVFPSGRMTSLVAVQMSCYDRIWHGKWT
jgi:hypothetical protein